MLIVLTIIVEPSTMWITYECGGDADVVNVDGYGVMWLKKAESKSQEEDLLGKSERKTKDALPEHDKTFDYCL